MNILLFGIGMLTGVLILQLSKYYHEVKTSSSLKSNGPDGFG